MPAARGGAYPIPKAARVRPNWHSALTLRIAMQEPASSVSRAVEPTNASIDCRKMQPPEAYLMPTRLATATSADTRS
jgi:hypothetical protein